VKGAFHGRTERPAIYSDSSRKNYVQHLASFRGEDSLLTVEPYSVEQLRAVFAEADAKGWFIEAMFLEPVMGEGDPGRAVPVAFYEAARELTKEVSCSDAARTHVATVAGSGSVIGSRPRPSSRLRSADS